MPTEPTTVSPPKTAAKDEGVGTKRPLSPAAQRALDEAAARRAERDRAPSAASANPAREANGPAGPEPTRYGDWEIKGIASDF